MTGLSHLKFLAFDLQRCDRLSINARELRIPSWSDLPTCQLNVARLELGDTHGEGTVRFLKVLHVVLQFFNEPCLGLQVSCRCAGSCLELRNTRGEGIVCFTNEVCLGLPASGSCGEGIASADIAREHHAPSPAVALHLLRMPPHHCQGRATDSIQPPHRTARKRGYRGRSQDLLSQSGGQALQCRKDR
jgi:hypothetical protein